MCRIKIAVAGLVILTVFFTVMLQRAFPHGWITGYVNRQNQLCCGDSDCAVIDKNDVEILPTGYRIKSLNEFIAFRDATPSEDGQYWRCYWGGERKCFFAPTGSS